MEAYKKIIKMRIIMLTIVAAIAAIISIYDSFIIGADQNENTSFQFGLIIGLGLLSILKIIQYRRIINDNKKLQIEYNKENDERTKNIKAKAGMPMLLISSSIMIIAGIIAGYFNTVVFLTLIIAAMCQLTIGAFTKIYYMKRM